MEQKFNLGILDFLPAGPLEIGKLEAYPGRREACTTIDVGIQIIQPSSQCDGNQSLQRDIHDKALSNLSVIQYE